MWDHNSAGTPAEVNWEQSVMAGQRELVAGAVELTTKLVIK